MVKLMSVKNNVLKLLEENRGVFLSGEKTRLPSIVL